MLKKGKKEEKKRSILEEEQMQSPFRTILKRLCENKIAMGSAIVFCTIFLMCFILPIWLKQDMNYQDPTQKNIAPGMKFLDVPKELQGNAKKIEAGPTFGVGIDNDGVVYEWGTLTDRLKQIPGDMGKVVDIAVGQDHVLALNEEGKLFTWGFNRMNLNRIPTELKGKKVKSISAGFQVSIVVLEDGSVVKWGNENAIDVVTSKVKDEKVKSVKTNIQTGLALTEDGKLIPMAKRETAFDAIPEEIQGKVKDFALTDKTAFALLEDGTLACWGANDYKIQSIPEEIDGHVESLSAGRNHVVALLDDGSVKSWGGNNNKQIKVPGDMKNIVAVSSRYYQNYAIDKDGNVKTWGLKGYLFGTDNLGRSVALRMLKGGQMTMTVGFVSVIISLVIGIIVGGIAGYYAGKIDIILMRVAEVVGSLPFIPLALILSALIGNKVSEIGRIIMIMVILGILSWPGVANMVRAQVLAERQKEFVTAAKALGVRERNIIFRHIVPNVMTIIIVNATLAFATCMLTESGLSFLGFGVGEPIPSWGNMLNNCRSSEVISQFWWRWVFPSIALALCTISINLFGDGLRKAVDPKSNER
jgi:peptide/nickel transport system permease protein